MGSPKNDAEEKKPTPNVIPMDLLIPLLCPTYQEGIEKYYKNSWRMGGGFPISLGYDSLIRHLTAFYFKKEDYDKETEEKFGFKKHHLGAIIFWAICMYDTLENHPKLDDRKKDFAPITDIHNSLIDIEESDWIKKLKEKMKNNPEWAEKLGIKFDGMGGLV